MRLGHSPMKSDKRKQMARLLQLHYETHPLRIAERLGVTRQYVTRVWSETPPEEMAPVDESLRALKAG